MKVFQKNLDLAMKLGSLYAYFGNFRKAVKYFNYIVVNDSINYEANMFLAKIYRE